MSQYGGNNPPRGRSSRGIGYPSGQTRSRGRNHQTQRTGNQQITPSASSCGRQNAGAYPMKLKDGRYLLECGTKLTQQEFNFINDVPPHRPPPVGSSAGGDNDIMEDHQFILQNSIQQDTGASKSYYPSNNTRLSSNARIGNNLIGIAKEILPSVPPLSDITSSVSSNTAISNGNTFNAASSSGISSIKPETANVSGNNKRPKLLRQELFRKSPLTPSEKLIAQYSFEVALSADSSDETADDCSICMSSLAEDSPYLSDEDGARDIVGSVQLSMCRHMFHTGCLIQLVKHQTSSLSCPNCHTIHGIRTGTQPVGGRMDVTTNRRLQLPGHNGAGAIVISYSFHGGVQGPEHPNPGRHYNLMGFPRVCYLPDNVAGRKVLSLLRVAFERRLTFTVGTSVTTGSPDSVVWNDIHHKTEVSNSGGHGYPDPLYLDNVTKELANVGVTETSIAQAAAV